jgi:uncharacterized phage-like protein YoqJ
MIVGITGHRPEKIPDPTWVKVRMENALLNIHYAQMVIQGMASGVDLWSAKIAYRNKIPFTCARPWKGHKPRVADEYDYRKAIGHAARVYDVSPFEDYVGPWVYEVRNRWMVDESQEMLAVWDGTKSGTANAVQYAILRKIPVYRIDPAKKTEGWINVEDRIGA